MSTDTQSPVEPYSADHRDAVVKFLATQVSRPDPPGFMDLLRSVETNLGIRIPKGTFSYLKRKGELQAAALQSGDEKEGGDHTEFEMRPPVVETIEEVEAPESSARGLALRRSSWECPQGHVQIEEEGDNATLHLAVVLRLPANLALRVNDLLWNEVFKTQHDPAEAS